MPRPCQNRTRNEAGMNERTMTASARRRKVAADPGGSRRASGRAAQSSPRRAVAAQATRGKAPSRAGSALDRARGLAAAAGRLRVPLVVAAVVLVVLVTLYGPAQGLYQAWRDQGINQQTLDELNASIDEYQSDIDRLQTREGIEDEARRRGYVEQGESGVTAVGLPDESDQGSEEQSLPWYLALGDFVFQYQEQR